MDDTLKKDLIYADFSSVVETIELLEQQLTVERKSSMTCPICHGVVSSIDGAEVTCQFCLNKPIENISKAALRYVLSANSEIARLRGEKERTWAKFNAEREAREKAEADLVAEKSISEHRATEQLLLSERVAAAEEGINEIL